MTDNKHTQGKWEPCKYGTRPNLKNAVVVWNEDHHTPIAKCVGDNSEANAILISTSPDMLDELERVALGLENIDTEWAKERLEFVREVIAKAKGS